MSRRISIRYRLLLAAVLPAGLFLAGCGSVGEPSPVDSTQPNAVGYGSEVRLFTDGYRDPSAIQMQQGLYYLYLSKIGEGGGTYVLQSNDALTWTQKTPVIFPGVSEGRAFRTATGVRFYYPSQPFGSGQPAEIVSAFSPDGITFTADAGSRVSPRPGYALGGMTVFTVGPSTYRMLFEEYPVDNTTQRRGEIWGASSQDGLTWVRDTASTIVAQDEVEGIVPFPQALHPCVVAWPQGMYTLFYSSHSQVYAASGFDGVDWTKTGTTGIAGTDMDGLVLASNALRIYFGRFTTNTGNEIYTGVLSK